MHVFFCFCFFFPLTFTLLKIGFLKMIALVSSFGPKLSIHESLQSPDWSPGSVLLNTVNGAGTSSNNQGHVCP
jgi:hypothetical protein